VRRRHGEEEGGCERKKKRRGESERERYMRTVGKPIGVVVFVFTAVMADGVRERTLKKKSRESKGFS